MTKQEEMIQVVNEIANRLGGFALKMAATITEKGIITPRQREIFNDMAEQEGILDDIVDLNIYINDDVKVAHMHSIDDEMTKIADQHKHNQLTSSLR